MHPSSMDFVTGSRTIRLLIKEDENHLQGDTLGPLLSMHLISRTLCIEKSITRDVIEHPDWAICIEDISHEESSAG